MNEPHEQAVLSDLSNLQQVLKDDASGERARRMLGYLAQVAQETAAGLSSVQIEAERQLTTQLIEAFYASQRVVQKVWEVLHGAPLTV